LERGGFGDGGGVGGVCNTPEALRIRAIIPASSTFGVPGADDDKIFDDILRSLERDRASLHRVACNLDVLRIIDLPSRLRQEKDLQVEGGASLNTYTGI